MTETLDENQQRALEMLAARGIGALFLDGVGWVWPEDIRTRPLYAEYLVNQHKRREGK